MQAQNIGILLINVAAIVLIALIVAYLTQDRRRFRVERQFRAVEALMNEWVELASPLPGCGDPADEYRKTRDVSRKYRLIAALIRASHGKTSVRMQALEQELIPFTQIYAVLAEDYDRHLTGSLRGPVMRLLGFQPLPLLRFDAEDESRKEQKSNILKP